MLVNGEIVSSAPLLQLYEKQHGASSMTVHSNTQQQQQQQHTLAEPTQLKHEHSSNNMQQQQQQQQQQQPYMMSMSGGMQPYQPVMNTGDNSNTGYTDMQSPSAPFQRFMLNPAGMMIPVDMSMNMVQQQQHVSMSPSPVPNLSMQPVMNMQGMNMTGVPIALPLSVPMNLQTPPQETSRALDKLKHSQNEVRRRSVLRNKFSLLRTVSGCVKKDRLSILETAIAKLQQMNQRQGGANGGNSSAADIGKNDEVVSPLSMSSTPVGLSPSPVMSIPAPTHSTSNGVMSSTGVSMMPPVSLSATTSPATTSSNTSPSSLLTSLAAISPLSGNTTLNNNNANFTAAQQQQQPHQQSGYNPSAALSPPLPNSHVDSDFHTGAASATASSPHNIDTNGTAHVLHNPNVRLMDNPSTRDMACCYIGLDGKYLEVNQRFIDTFCPGLSNVELIASDRTIFNLLMPAHLMTVLAALQNILTHQVQSYQQRVLCINPARNAAPLAMQLTINPIIKAPGSSPTADSNTSNCHMLFCVFSHAAPEPNATAGSEAPSPSGSPLDATLPFGNNAFSQ